MSLGSATAIAVTGLISVATPSSATAAPIVKSFDFKMKIATPATAVSVPATINDRLDFNADFADDDITNLQSHIITVKTQDTGFALQNGSTQVIVYANFRFMDSSNTVLAERQINNAATGEALGDRNSITVPATATKMTIGWVAARNLGNMPGDVLTAGTYSSVPKIYDNGSAESPTSPAAELAYVSDATSTAGLYFKTEVSNSFGPNVNIEGITQSFNLPATGTIHGVKSTAAACIDLTKISSATTATPSIKLNGATPSSAGFRISDSTSTYGGMNDVNGTTFDFSSGQLSTWRTATTPLYVFATAGGMYGGHDTTINTNGSAVDETFDLVDANNVSILKSCTPTAPTGTGTLGAGQMPGSVALTPTTFVPPTGEWACNLYKVSDNSLLTSGSGWGSSNACMFASYGPNGPLFPTGVPMYAKVVSTVKLLGQTFSTAGAEKSNNYTATSGGGGGGGPTPPPLPAGFYAPKLTWPSTKALAANTTITAVKSNVPGTRRFNWVRCSASYSRAAGKSVNFMNGESVFPNASCELLTTTAGWKPRSEVAVQNSQYTAKEATTYKILPSDVGKNISVIEFQSGNTVSVVAVSKTVKIGDKTDPNYPTTALTLRKNAKLTIAGKNNQGLTVVVASTTATKCTVAKLGTNYVITGKALGTCLVKLTVTGKGFILSGNETHAITIN